MPNRGRCCFIPPADRQLIRSTLRHQRRKRGNCGTRSLFSEPEGFQEMGFMLLLSGPEFAESPGSPAKRSPLTATADVGRGFAHAAQQDGGTGLSRRYSSAGGLTAPPAALNCSSRRPSAESLVFACVNLPNA